MKPPVRIMSVVGARPNFMKIAPFVHAIERHNLRIDSGQNNGEKRIAHFLVHTGQHYDAEMSASFFNALNIPKPDRDLGVGSGSHAEQVGRTMIEFEKVVQEWNPDWIVVVGDVNATCACSITAKKEGVRLAHIEAGLRSFDLGMPEEINRMVTDRLSDVLFVTDEIAAQNLRAEGVDEEQIKLVGNIMIDTLEAQRAAAEKLGLRQVLTENCLRIIPGHSSQQVRMGPASPGERDRAGTGLERGIRDGAYAVLTMHRPSNVDQQETLEPLVAFLLETVAEEMTLLWTLHPRTRQRLEWFGLWERVCAHDNVILLNPLGYHAMLRLNMGARILLTDSGGLQEECCVLGTPCVTLRFNTERPVTLVEHHGVSRLAGNRIDDVRSVYRERLASKRKPCRPPLWDGHTADRIVTELLKQ